MGKCKKWISLFLAIILSASPVLAAEDSEKVYLQADVSEDQTVRLTSLGDGKFNILKNGDFETVNASGAPTGWSVVGAQIGESYMTTCSAEAVSGKNFARFYGETENAYLSQSTTAAIPGKTYTFSAKVRKTAGQGSVLVYISADEKTETSHASVKKFNQTVAFEKSYKGEWIDVTMECELPAETARVGFMLRLVGGGEVHWDDVRFVGEVKEELKKAAEFRTILAEEAAMDEGTNILEKGALRQYDTPFTGQSNLIANGNFETNDGAMPENWALRSDFKPFFSLVKGGSHDGSDCVKFNLSGEKDGTKHPFLSQDIPLIGGAEYQVSFKYKITKGTGAEPRLKLEYYSQDRNLPGAKGVGEKYAGPEKENYTGTWETVVLKVYPSKNVADAAALLRVMQANPLEEVEVYFDDVEVYMTAPPPAFEIDGGWIFYYSDMKEGTLSTEVNMAYYPDLASAKVDYAILYGTDIIWESQHHIGVQGKTAVTFPLSVLKEKEKAYRARATLYNTDGSVHSVATQNVYIYDRPQYLKKDGTFLKEGKKEIYPVFAYHVTRTQEDFRKVAEAGVTVIQTSVDNEADVKYLDWCEEAGLMALITLYPGGKCAGHDDNIEYTIGVLNATMDHPATLGYIVMDEVFMNRADAETEMENSYRLIHSLDKKHPVTVMEAADNFYEKAGKYVDLLLTDPYSKAHARHASEGTANARAALQYEKPVYSLLETYHATGGSAPGYPTPNDGRNNNWQALIAGANAVGYYSINDSDINPETGKYSIPIWDARDGGALWKALISFGKTEKELAYNHFVFNKTPYFNEYRGDKYWYASWVDGQDIYMIVLGMLQSGTQEISIPLTSFAGDIKVGDYTAVMLAGREKLETVTGSGTLDIKVSDVEALFYKITPSQAVDFSSLGFTAFEDLLDFGWARQQIARMDAAGVITGRNMFSYAPADKITRGEFAGFLVRALGLTSDSTELFTDVDADYEFAKEIAVGRALGILKGTDGVNYNPDAEISRQDLMVICARSMRLKKALEEGGDMTFTDKDAIADYAIVDIAAMVRAGIVTGYTDGTIQPLGNTTRAEAAVIMDRIVNWSANP